MNKSPTTVSIIAVLIFAISILAPVAEASDSASHKIVVEVPVILVMSITSNGRTSSGETVVTRYEVLEPTDRELNQGYVEQEDAANLAITANVDWKVTLRSEKSTLGRSADGEYEKPASDLMVRCSGSSFGYQSVSTSPSTIFEGGSGIFNHGLDYKTIFDKDQYKSGSYEATLIYTISSRA